MTPYIVTRDTYTSSGDLVHALCFTEAGNPAVFCDELFAQAEALIQRGNFPGYRIRVIKCPVI